jgi:hypothetical protein
MSSIQEPHLHLEVGHILFLDIVGRDEVGRAVTRARKGGKAGTLYKPQTVRRLLKCVRDGLNLKQAAIACGIGESTLHEWKREHPEFLQKLEETREQARQLALETIWNARGDDWRAAEAFLKYSFHQDYRSGAQVNVNQNTAVVVEKTMTEEDRLKIIAQRERSKQKHLSAPQDKPAVIEAQIVGGPQCYRAEPEPTEQTEQPEPQPEPEQAYSGPTSEWLEKHEERQQQAVVIATKEAEEKERQRRINLDRMASAQLFGSDD